MKNKINDSLKYISAVILIFSALISLGSNNSKNIQSPSASYTEMDIADNISVKSSDEIGIPAKKFYAALVDNNNNKWFLTELGIISFEGDKWILHNKDSQFAGNDLKDFAFDSNPDGSEIWVVSPNGAAVTSLPLNAGNKATTYLAENAEILSNNVVKVAIGNNHLRWFGTDKGVSALINGKWLTPSYDEAYPEMIFQEYPITSMATNPAGDSLYVGTDGAGIARVFRNDVDGISGASGYAQWGPIIIPSDKIYSVFIESDGTKWFGTDLGVAMHTGNNSLENWTVYTTDDGLVNNFVQSIVADKKGNLWFGTKDGGISVFDGSAWTTYTSANGLNSNNILCMVLDKDGTVWIGTDDGVTCYKNGEFINFK